MKAFAAYAAPLQYGPKVDVASHLGTVSLKISYSAVSAAIVLGRIHYFKPGQDEKVTESLSSGTTITTADVAANVEVDFQGVVTGSAVSGTIEP